MRRGWFLVVALMFFSGPVASEAPRPAPMLWRITDAKDPLVAGYVLATVPGQLAEHAALDKAVWTAVAGAGVIQLETRDNRHARDKAPTLNTAVQQRLLARCTKDGLESCETLSAPRVADQLLRLRRDQLGLDMDVAGAAQVHARARTLKKVVVESPMEDPWVGLLATHHPTDNDAFTMVLANALDAELQSIPKLHAAGDDVGIGKAWGGLLGRAPNRVAVKADMEAALTQTLGRFEPSVRLRQKALLVLDVVRVVGPDGALAKLQKAGWTVERVSAEGPGALVDSWVPWTDAALGVEMMVPGEVSRTSTEKGDAKVTMITAYTGQQWFLLMVVHMSPDASGALMALGIDAALAKMAGEKKVKSSSLDEKRDVWTLVSVEDGQERTYVAAIRRAGFYVMAAPPQGAVPPTDVRRMREKRFLASLRVDQMVGVDTTKQAAPAPGKTSQPPPPNKGRGWPLGTPVDAVSNEKAGGGHLEMARAALAAGKLETAIREAAQAADELPQEREPLELWAACLDELRREKEAREVYKRLAKLPSPPASEPAAPTAAFNVEDTAYVSVARARVRDKADRSGKVVMTLLVNSPVRVVEVNGDWIGIALPHPERAHAGYLHRSLVAPAQANFDALMAAAKTADAREATRALEKALLLQPLNEQVARALANNAVASRNFGTAANVGVRFGAVTLPRAVPGETAVCFGCSEDALLVSDVINVFEAGKRKTFDHREKGEVQRCVTWGTFRQGTHAGREIMTCTLQAKRTQVAIRMAVGEKDVVILSEVSTQTPRNKKGQPDAPLFRAVAGKRAISEDVEFRLDAIAVRSTLYSDEAWVIEDPYSFVATFADRTMQPLFTDRLQGTVMADERLVNVVLPDVTVRYTVKRKFDDTDVALKAPWRLAPRYASARHWGDQKTFNDGHQELTPPSVAEEKRLLHEIELVSSTPTVGSMFLGMVRGNPVLVVGNDDAEVISTYLVQDPFGRYVEFRSVETIPPDPGE